MTAKGGLGVSGKTDLAVEGFEEYTIRDRVLFRGRASCLFSCPHLDRSAEIASVGSYGRDEEREGRSTYCKLSCSRGSSSSGHLERPRGG